MLQRNFDSFGFADALSAAQSAIDLNSRVLEDYAASKIPCAAAPLFFDSQSLAILAYKGAMERVRTRFWTTTFLGSGFWSDSGGEILDSNIRMMNNCRRAGAAVRRLFLLPLPLDDELQRIQDQRILLLKCEDADGLARFDERLANLARNISLLSHYGCDLRVIHDSEGLHRALPAELNADPRDTEIAIYDDWRFDLYQGGMFGAIQSVQCYTPAMPRFAEYRDALARYFEGLLEKSAPIEALLDRLRKTVEESSSRIDYPVSWLVHYDHALPREDEALKVEELSSVRVDLVRLGRWGAVQRFLDVGTCTGRYLFALRDAVTADGTILGIDNNIDCVRFAQSKVRRELGSEPRIRVERQDFRAAEAALPQSFDLVTCMLGTVLHFERQHDRGPPFDDPFQHALEKFARLLTPDGLLFFSVWTEEACRALRLLSIYSQADKQRLAAAPLTGDELEQRIECAGLRAPVPILLQQRLALYRCERGPSGPKHTADVHNEESEAETHHGEPG
jgi:SAM-dependent methyltransferase